LHRRIDLAPALSNMEYWWQRRKPIPLTLLCSVFRKTFLWA
jgi:hypothetical protein